MSEETAMLCPCHLVDKHRTKKDGRWWNFEKSIKIEWDLITGPVSKLLELLTQFKGAFSGSEFLETCVIKCDEQLIDTPEVHLESSWTSKVGAERKTVGFRIKK